MEDGGLSYELLVTWWFSAIVSRLPEKSWKEF
jgi:hypothetical protein